jgi:hypothetical protein
VHLNPLLNRIGDGLNQSTSRERVDVVTAVVVCQTCLQGVVAPQARDVDAGVESLLAGDELVVLLARGHCVGCQLVRCCGMIGESVVKWIRGLGSGKKSGEVGIVVLAERDLLVRGGAGEGEDLLCFGGCGM